MRTRGVLLGGLVAALLCGPLAATAQQAARPERPGLVFAVLGAPYGSRASETLLRGLAGVSLFGRYVTVDTVTIDVDSMLVREGVPVARSTSQKTPRLIVSIGLSRIGEGGPAAHMVSLVLAQPVALQRDASLEADLATWVASTGPVPNGPTEKTDPAVVATEIAELVRRFAVAYHAANP